MLFAEWADVDAVKRDGFTDGIKLWVMFSVCFDSVM